MRLKFKKKDRKAIARALGKGRRVNATVRLKGADVFNNKEKSVARSRIR